LQLVLLTRNLSQNCQSEMRRTIGESNLKVEKLRSVSLRKPNEEY